MLSQGDKINNYTLEKYLGKGSYGEVWLAKKTIELSDDGILVALKFLGYQPNKDKTQADFLKQVKREVGTWIKASGHKNIVSVQDSFAFRDDTFVIVSDFAEGGSLADWLQANGGKSPNPEKTVEVMSEILDALAHLHSQKPDKIIHRDLKPDNILFKSGVPCLTDFGVSRMSQTITQSMAQMAATSAGTPLYMSPESFQNQPASRSMDIWSAGVILYQMLAGDFPYYADNPISLALEIISGKPPNPLPKDVPNEFQAIVAKALGKDISQGFQTAEEMKAGLKEALKTWGNAQSQPIIDSPRPVQSTEIPVSIQPINNTILDEDFDMTEVLEIEPTVDRGEIEATKQRQRTLAETQKLKETEETQKAEIQPISIEFAGLKSEEEKWKKDEREKQRRKISKTVLAIIVFMLVGFPFIGGLFRAISWGNSNQPTANKSNQSVINNANKSLNINSNQPVNSPANKPANTSNNLNPFKDSIGMEFIKIPSGTFMMGAPPNDRDFYGSSPPHQVTISNGFYLGKYEVTQGQWKVLMGDNPSHFKDCGDNCPVEQVSWERTQEFIQKLNAKGEGVYRLPTEAEWEYACRAGTTGDFNGNNLDKIAWYEKNAGDKTNPVGQKQANAFGLYDMHGNVSEWTADWFGNYQSGSVTDPKGPVSGKTRVYRGGNYFSFNGGWGLPSAGRASESPNYSNHQLGFRLIRIE